MKSTFDPRNRPLAFAHGAGAARIDVVRRSSLGLIALAAIAVVPEARALAAGEGAPGLSLPGTDGEVSLAQDRGKLVYLDFWASWCVPCRKSFPWMNDMQHKYGARGLSIVAVNVDAKLEDARRFLAENPASFKVAFDAKGESPKAFAIKGMPSSVLIAPDGKVIATHAGFRDEDRVVLEDKIRAALPARP